MELHTDGLSLIFDTKFLQVNTDVIADNVRSNGYFCFEGALKKDYSERLVNNINFDKISVNENDAGVVTSNNSKYLTHCLAYSREVYNIITAAPILKICQSYFKKGYSLSSHRVYLTQQSNHMPWHTDNNRQDGDRLLGKHAMRGLLFLVYLSDVSKNAFQFIAGSHHYSEQYADDRYIANSYINSKYSKDIVTFKLTNGSLIICDTHGIHRAEPFHDKTYRRLTLLFQVDEVDECIDGHGERNLVDTSFVKDLTPQLMIFLGFGLNKNYPPFPQTSIATLPITEIAKLQKMILIKMFTFFFKRIIKLSLTGETLIKLKRIFWRLSTKNVVSKK